MPEIIKMVVSWYRKAW